MFAHEAAFLHALQGQSEALANLNASPQFSERLAVYQTSILGTLQQALYKNFKPLERLIGQEAFQELCYRYAATHLSAELNLSQYGADLYEFVKTAPFAEDYPYLPDFIEFCFVWKQVYLRGEAMWIESDYPVYEIWQRCQSEFCGQKEIDNWQGPFMYGVYREEGRVIVRQTDQLASFAE